MLLPPDAMASPGKPPVEEEEGPLLPRNVTSWRTMPAAMLLRQTLPFLQHYLCIIRAGYLDDIKQAFQRDPELVNLLTNSHFAPSIASRNAAWRKVVSLAVMHGVAVPGMANSMAYFDGYRRESCPANLV